MKVLVCGGRDYDDLNKVEAVLDDVLASYGTFLLIQGGARGADKMAKEWALEKGLPCCTYHAPWGVGKRAGAVRNGWMVKYGSPDLVIAFPGGCGTKDMVWKALQAGIKVMEIRS